MKSIVTIALVAAGLLAAPAMAQSDTDDFRMGLEAYRSGDYESAVIYWQDLAENDDARAQYGLGFAYQYGRGVPKDLAEAEQWYRRAAERGSPDAYYALGLLLQDRRDFPAAREAFTVSALNFDHAPSQYAVGLMLYRGIGIGKDVEMALNFFESAAAQNHPAAKYMLGMYSEAGRDPGDKVGAYYWYSLAATHGTEALQEFDPSFDPLVVLDHLRGQMTPAEIAEAERRLGRIGPNS